MIKLSDILRRPRRERPSVRRINRIARHVDVRSYLEIGVNAGLTFNALNFEHKVAVDPHFRFSVADYRRDGVEFHAVPSDAYFTGLARPVVFDLIFLDGLHTFQQTFRDFCNSLACCGPQTIWLIDDVLPTDAFSALPDQNEALRLRKQAGGEGTAWHGDVFKLMFVLHDFFPMFSWVTLGADDNAQALVWRAPRENFSPRFNNMEAIERMTYFDLLENMRMLNRTSEEEGLRRFFAATRRQPVGEGQREP